MGILDKLLRRKLPVETGYKKPQSRDAMLLAPDAVITQEFADSAVAALGRTGVAEEIVSYEISE